MSFWINGVRSTSIDCRDRGLHYGDGVFETMLVKARQVRLLDFHLMRLAESCRRLQLQPPADALLRREIQRVVKGRARGVLKLTLTRGVGPRGYRPTGNERTTRILSLYPATARALPDMPVRVRMCSTPLSINPALAGLKTLNRLDVVLARSEWRTARFWEGLMRDVDGHIVCGTMSNLFLRRGSQLLVPKLDRCGVAGVMRRWVLERAAVSKLSIAQRRVGWADLERAEEIFLTNAVIGVVSVKSVTELRRSVTPPSYDLSTRLRRELESV